jgi:hypothetical protein
MAPHNSVLDKTKHFCYNLSMLTIKDFFPSTDELDNFFVSLPVGHAVIINQTRGWLQVWKMAGKKLVKTIPLTK